MKTAKKFKPLGKDEIDPIENWLELNEIISNAVSFVRFIAEDRKIDDKSLTLEEIREEAQAYISDFDECLEKARRQKRTHENR
jgi:hypothetical protein